MDFKDLVQKRRSIRKFTDEPIDPEHLQLILRSALMAPTGKSVRGWHFIVVEDKDMLQKLSLCRQMGSQFLAEAAVAIVVLGDHQATDVWTEDSTIAAVTMQYQIADLGLGSCWCQVRNRFMNETESTDNILRFLLHYPDNLIAECIIGIGHPAQDRKLQDEDKLKWENVHIGVFDAE